MACFSGPEISNNGLIAYYDPFNHVFSSNNIITNIYNTAQVLELFDAVLDNNFISLESNNSLKFDISAVRNVGTIEFQMIKNTGFNSSSIYSSEFIEHITFDLTSSVIVAISWNVNEITNIEFYVNGNNIKSINIVSELQTNEGPVIVKCLSNDTVRFGYIKYYNYKLSSDDIINNSNAMINRKF